MGQLRKSSIFLSFLGVSLVILAGLAADARVRAGRGACALAERRMLVKSLSLTDLVLFTDARYTRHPAMADLHAPFQDHPISLEHFPSGSLMPPPPHARAHGQR